MAVPLQTAARAVKMSQIMINRVPLPLIFVDGMIGKPLDVNKAFYCFYPPRDCPKKKGRRPLDGLRLLLECYRIIPGIFNALRQG